MCNATATLISVDIAHVRDAPTVVCTLLNTGSRHWVIPVHVELARGLAEQCEPTQIKDKALVLQKVTTVKLDQEYCDILYFVLSRMYIESIIVDIII